VNTWPVMHPVSSIHSGSFPLPDPLVT
jgi:hypothetical protein